MRPTNLSDDESLNMNVIVSITKAGHQFNIEVPSDMLVNEFTRELVKALVNPGDDAPGGPESWTLEDIDTSRIRASSQPRIGRSQRGAPSFT